MTERQLDFILAALKEIQGSDRLLYNFHLKDGHLIRDIWEIQFLQNGLVRMVDAKFATMCSADDIVAVTRVA